MKKTMILALCILAISMVQAQKVKLGVAGLTHSHVHWIFSSAEKGDFEIVGIAEPNKALAKRFFDQYNLSWDLYYSTLDEMIEKSKPQGVTAFNSIYEHLEVVEKCAPKGIHVMVEKPLAVNMQHARRMEQLALEHEILLITNYETTWYPSNHEIKMRIEEGAIGGIRKIIVRDGHQGPKEIGVQQEFLDWLTDPKMNGGGAVIDFGCYGANLSTWLMNNEKPMAVTALMHTNKPDVYPKVDDEATILLQYPESQVIIQASWNWPYSRKDVDVYGVWGQLSAPDGNTVTWLPKEGEPVKEIKPTPLKPPYTDPFDLFSAAIQGDIKIKPTDLSSLENNMIVVEILESAIKSATEGKTVQLSK